MNDEYRTEQFSMKISRRLRSELEEEAKRREMTVSAVAFERISEPRRTSPGLRRLSEIAKAVTPGSSALSNFFGNLALAFDQWETGEKLDISDLMEDGRSAPSKSP
jgi:hypothetical protein